MVKNVILFLLFVAAGVAGLTIYFEQSANALNNKSQNLISPLPNKSATFSIENAPSDSLRGRISAMTGTVSWESRTSTYATQIADLRSLQQGESITTGDDGTATIEFASASAILIGNDTSIDFIQTLPIDNVFSQDTGSATYTKIGTTPVSIRSNTLLIEIASGAAQVAVSKTRPQITVSVKKGTATAAYNDLQYLSHEQEIDAGQSFLFNYSTEDGTME